MPQRASSQDRILMLGERAAALIALRKFDLAAREVRQSLRIDPQNAGAHHTLAYIFWRQGKLREARQEAETALRLAPNTAKFHSTLAAILSESGPGLVDAAFEHHKRALALEPTEPLYHYRYASRLLSSGFKDAAWRESEVCLRLDPRHAAAHLLQAEIYRQRADLSQAENSALTALSIDPQISSAHDLLGDIYMEAHRAGKALGCYRTALRLNPTDKPLKRKIVLALEARIPFLGVFWKISLRMNNALNRKIMRYAVMALIGMSLWILSQGDFGASFVCLLYCVPLLVPLGGLIFIIDPLLTRAFLKGWIKIDESLEDAPKKEINTTLARFIKIPYLLLALILFMVCSMAIFGYIGTQSPSP